MPEQLQPLKGRVIVEDRQARRQRLQDNAEASIAQECAMTMQPNTAPLAQGYYARDNARRKKQLKKPRRADGG